MRSPPSEPPPRSSSRMPSAVRVRRHANSRFLRFLDASNARRDAETSSAFSPTVEEDQQASSTGQASTKPRLGFPDARKRPTYGRRQSAVERLIANDKKQADGNINEAKQGSRATMGHAPQLSSVSEDHQTSGEVGNGGTRLGSALYADTIGEEGESPGPPLMTGESNADEYFDAAQSEGADTSSTRRLQPQPGGNLAASDRRAEPHVVPRFLTPLADRSRGTPSPNLRDATENPGGPGSSPPSNRLRRPLSRVSIPTPVKEEAQTPRDGSDDENHADDVADYLDVVDPEVGALGYLSNIGNSIFFPHIPQVYDRRPTHDLPSNRRRGASVSSALSKQRGSQAPSSRSSRHSQDSGAAAEEGRAGSPEATFQGGSKAQRIPSKSMLTRMSSAVGWTKKDDEEEFTKHIKDWREMDEEERDELDEHVRMLLTKKSKFKRGAKGFYAFVKTPLGFIMTLYGFLITFWGTAIMLFIFDWIKAGERQRYWIEICDQILCALFAAVGLGFAPFRAVDTYRMIHIAHYHHLTWKRRTELGLTRLNDPNDLPRPEKDGSNQVARAEEDEDDSEGLASPMSGPEGFVTESKRSFMTHNRSLPSSVLPEKKERHRSGSGHKYQKKVILPDGYTQQAEEADPTGKTGDLSKGRKGLADAPPLERNMSIKSELVKEKEDVVVLTKGEQEVLEHHQRKFHASHTFYRYHETSTHKAFPLDLMIVIVCLLDCHSLLQGALGGCTWGIKYTHRPTVLTATLITCSLSCNAVAGIIIWIGGRKTKKREEVERRLRIALEQEALEKIERRRARGELPDRNHGESQLSDEERERQEQEVDDEARDRLAKELVATPKRRSSKAAADHLEMSPMQKKLPNA